MRWMRSAGRWTTLLNDDQMEQGGLKVYTTIDPAMQKAAQVAVDGQLRKVEQRPGYKHPIRAQYAGQSLDADTATPYLQGALVMVDNRSGGIRALVGGRDYWREPLQPGAFRKAPDGLHVQAVRLRRRICPRLAAHHTHRRRADPPRRIADGLQLAPGRIPTAPTTARCPPRKA